MVRTPLEAVLSQLMDIEHPSLYNCYFVESCQTGPSKREIRNFRIVIRLFVSYLFVHADCNFLPPEKLRSCAKMMSLVFAIYKFGREIFIIGICFEILCRNTKKTYSSPSYIKCIIKAWKKNVCTLH